MPVWNWQHNPPVTTPRLPHSPVSHSSPWRPHQYTPGVEVVPKPKVRKTGQGGAGEGEGIGTCAGGTSALRVWPIVVLGVLPAISLASNLQAGSLPLGTHQGHWWVLVVVLLCVFIKLKYLVCIGLLCGCIYVCVSVCLHVSVICNVSSS